MFSLLQKRSFSKLFVRSSWSWALFEQLNSIAFNISWCVLFIYRIERHSTSLHLIYSLIVQRNYALSVEIRKYRVFQPVHSILVVIFSFSTFEHGKGCGSSIDIINSFPPQHGPKNFSLCIYLKKNHMYKVEGRLKLLFLYLVHYEGGLTEADDNRSKSWGSLSPLCLEIQWVFFLN